MDPSSPKRGGRKSVSEVLSPRAGGGKTRERRGSAKWEAAELEPQMEAVRTATVKRIAAVKRLVVRSKTREDWNPISQQPFAQRAFVDTMLSRTAPVNSGQLLGFMSQKGGNPPIPNLDEYVVLFEAGYQFYVIVDGRGEDGEGIAKFTRRFLVSALQSLVQNRNGRVLGLGEVTDLFNRLHQTLEKEDGKRKNSSMDVRYSGCSALVVVVTPTRSLRGAWLGDCECVVGRKGANPRVLNPPHTVAGTTPSKLTRCIGLLAGGYSHEPDEFVEADIDKADFDFLLLGSGGFWKGITKVHAVDEVVRAGPMNAQHACCHLAMRSQENQLLSADPSLGPAAVEDATLIAVWLGTY